MPTDVTPGLRSIASAPTAASRGTTTSGLFGDGRRDLSPVEDPPFVGVPLDDHPLDVRTAKIEPEMATRGRAVPHVDQDSAVTRV